MKKEEERPNAVESGKCEKGQSSHVTGQPLEDKELGDVSGGREIPSCPKCGNTRCFCRD